MWLQVGWLQVEATAQAGSDEYRKHCNQLVLQQVPEVQV
jgi:hypothetical protein